MKYEITCPYCGNNQTYKPRKEVPKQPHTKCSKCKREFNFTVDNPDKTIVEKQSKIIDKNTPGRESYSPTNTTGSIAEKLNNPVKFVQTIIVDELVNTRDVRWAQLFVSILDKTNKLDYESIRETEWSNQAKHMSMKELVEKVAKRESISRSTLRRLDDLGDTSQYESL